MGSSKSSGLPLQLQILQTPCIQLQVDTSRSEDQFRAFAKVDWAIPLVLSPECLTEIVDELEEIYHEALFDLQSSETPRVARIL